jgi:adenosylcobyric acid synthase
MATYLHSVFESPPACTALLEWGGLQAPQAYDYRALREQNLERLADALEAHLDMPRILQLLGVQT